MLSTNKCLSVKNILGAFAVLVASLSIQFSASAMDLVERAKAAGSFETLLTAAEASGLLGTLKGPGPYTIFAPSEKAFAKLPSGTISNLLKPENRKSLAFIINYHVVEGRITSFDIPLSRIEVPTLNGAKISLLSTGRKVTADAANIISADIMADNGVIHVVDKVLLPSIYRAPSVSTFNEVSKSQSPNDSSQSITTADIASQSVAVPKNSATFKFDLKSQVQNQRKMKQKRDKRPLAGKNLIQTANAAGQFRTLLLALQIARMDESVANYQNYTVFAPTDRAFEQVPSRTREFLFNPKNRAKLINLLAYHIVDGNLSSDRIARGSSKINTLNPRYALNIQNQNGRITVNNAKVVQADIRANNGLIHVIDRVLLTSPKLLKRR